MAKKEWSDKIDEDVIDERDDDGASRFKNGKEYKKGKKGRQTKVDRKKEDSLRKQGLMPLPEDILVDEDAIAESLPDLAESKDGSFSKSDKNSKELEDLKKDLEEAFSIKLENGTLTLNKETAKKPKAIGEKRENILAERKNIINQTKNNKLKIINNLFDISSFEPKDVARAKDILNNELKFEKFKIKIENFNARGLKDMQLKEFEKCVGDANAEILKRVNERRAELEVFIEKNEKTEVANQDLPEAKAVETGTAEETLPKTGTIEEAPPGVAPVGEKLPAETLPEEETPGIATQEINSVTDNVEAGEPADDLIGENNPAEDNKINNAEPIEEHRDEKGHESGKEIKEKIITGADLIGEESDRKIKELGDKLEEARRAYLKKDVEAEKIKLSLKSVLWKTLKIGSLGQYDKEHEDAKNEYNETLRAYKEEFLKAGLIEDKEDVKIMVDFLNLTETSSRESARTDIEAKNSKWWHLDNVSRGYMKIIESYKNIGKDDKSKFVRFAKKALVGVTIGGGVAFTGGIAAGAAGTVGAAWLWRMFTASVSATSFKAMYEDIADNIKQRDSAKEAENIFRNSKIEGVNKMKAELISENLNLMIKDIDSKMQKEKKYARWRSFGAVATAGTISYLGQMFGHEIMESVKEHFVGDLPISTGGSHAEKIVSGLSENNHVEKIIELKPVEAGGSIERSIREYLESNPSLVDKYNNSGLSGGRKFDAGQIAFRMFDELSKDHNTKNLPVGAKINLSADGLHIKEIPSLNLRNFKY